MPRDNTLNYYDTQQQQIRRRTGGRAGREQLIISWKKRREKDFGEFEELERQSHKNVKIRKESNIARDK